MSCGGCGGGGTAALLRLRFKAAAAGMQNFVHVHIHKFVTEITLMMAIKERFLLVWPQGRSLSLINKLWVINQKNAKFLS